MPRLADPSDIRSRPASLALGELAITAGLLGESLSIACDFPANTLCQVWKYYTQSTGAGNVIHVRAKRDLNELTRRMTGVRAAFVHCPRWYQGVAWSIQLAGSDATSPRPAVFCGFLLEDPDLDPGLTLPLSNDEREVAAPSATNASEPLSNCPAPRAVQLGKPPIEAGDLLTRVCWRMRDSVTRTQAHRR